MHKEGDIMSYDFEHIVNRSEKYSRKWERMNKRKGDLAKDIPPFSVADLDFKYPPQLISKFNEYTKDMIFGYSRPDDNYYNSFINWVKRRIDFEIERDWIVDGNGVVPAIYNAIKTFSSKGAGVIIMPPVYPPFKQSVIDTERTLVECPLVVNDDYYEIDFDLFKKLAADENNAMLIFCSPHNPVGRVWKKSELKKLAKIANENDILVVSDEIHMDFILEGHKHIMYNSLDETTLNNSIVLTSASKSFNLAGTQTSMSIIANQEMREAFEANLASSGFFGLNAFGFKLFEIAYNDCEDYFDELVALISKNHQYLYKFINEEVTGVKAFKLEGTYLQWLDFSGLNMSDEALFDFLIDECDLFLTAGDGYGLGGSQHLRWNIATPNATLKAGLNRLKTGVNQLK